MSHWELDPNEILLDRLAKEKEEEMRERKFETPLFSHFPFVFFLFIFLFFFLFLLRVFQLQFIEGKQFFSLAEANRFTLLKLNAERGIIFDRNREQLTFNKVTFDLCIQKNSLINEEVLRKIAKTFSLPFEDIFAKISSAKEDLVCFLNNLDRERLIIFHLEKDNFPNLVLKEKIKREYKEGEIFSPILGYLTQIRGEEFEKDKENYSISDLVGREGLEKYYEEYLRKKPGKILIERDARNNLKLVQLISPPKPGKNLVLYLDGRLQRKMKEEIEKKMKETRAIFGGGIAVDPKTGGILALVSLPSFDNNVFNEEDFTKIRNLFEREDSPLLNKATDGQFLLGSTVKPLLAIAALKEGIIRENTFINCQGKIEILDPYTGKITTKKDWTIHGFTNVKKAIAESCNVFFYAVGGGWGNIRGLGVEKIKNYLKKFGFEERAKVDFPTLTRGFIGDKKWKEEAKKEPWWIGDTFNLSIGQGYILATPLQVAQAFLPVANGGKFLKLRFVWKIESENGEVEKEFLPEEWQENFIDQEILKIVREGMRMTVSGEGAPLASAKSLNLLPVKAAAKTGTAQSPRKNCPECFTVWIVVFAPFEDPQILLVLFFDGVRDISTAVSIPVAFEILNWYFSENVVK